MYPAAVGAVLALLWTAASPDAQAATLATIYTARPGARAAPNVAAVRGLAVYGTDAAAGPAGAGSIFRLGASHAYRALYTFSGTADGATPNARLAFDRSGTLYGTTRAGGNLTLHKGAGLGTVFRLAKSGQFKVLHTFDGQTGGSAPRDGPALDLQGNLFGTASGGEVDPGDGAVFKIAANRVFSVLHAFQSGADGHCPFTGVVLDAKGDLFGTTVGMGFGGRPGGSVFEMTGSGFATRYGFANGADGGWPEITPTVDGAGNLYGLTNTEYGKPSFGAIWVIARTGAFRVLHRFSGAADGDRPNGPLLLGPAGNLYGTTLGGGDAPGMAGQGTVFQIAPSGALTTLHVFRGKSDGAGPTGGLALDASGHIYGGTQAGTIFELVP